MFIGFTGGFLVLYIFFFYTLYKKIKNKEVNDYNMNTRMKRGPYFLSVLILAFFGALFQWNLERGTYQQNDDYLLVGLMIIIGIIKLYLGIKRLHDINMVGWWSIVLFIPIYNLILLISLFIIPGTKERKKEESSLY